jgi:hypothetical protein
MLRRIAIVLPALLLAACSPSGKMENPFAKKAPFVATAVPADFVIVVDENHDTYYTRQHIQQVITAADSMSRTTYSNFRDYNNQVSRRFSQETPLSAGQLQAMWNAVRREEVMQGSSPWVNWRSDADLYKRNSYTIQIRANGRKAEYRQTNGFSGQVRPLMLLVEAVRLPITQDAGTHVVGPAAGELHEEPVVAPTQPASGAPGTDMPPATLPGSQANPPATNP